MKQMELPFMVEFEEYDRVIMISKNLGAPFGSGFAYDMKKGAIGSIEQVKIVTGYEHNHIADYPAIGTKYYIVNGGLFLGSDLRRAPK